MEFLRLGAKKEVPLGEIRQFNIRSKELLVINIDSQFYCLDARYTHAGAPLAEGTLSGDILTCPWHQSRFKITDGSVVGGPAKRPLRTYRIMVRDDQLFVEAEAA